MKYFRKLATSLLIAFSLMLVIPTTQSQASSQSTNHNQLSGMNYTNKLVVEHDETAIPYYMPGGILKAYRKGDKVYYYDKEDYTFSLFMLDDYTIDQRQYLFEDINLFSYDYIDLIKNDFLSLVNSYPQNLISSGSLSTLMITFKTGITKYYLFSLNGHAGYMHAAFTGNENFDNLSEKEKWVIHKNFLLNNDGLDLETNKYILENDYEDIDYVQIFDDISLYEDNEKIFLGRNLILSDDGYWYLDYSFERLLANYNNGTSEYFISNAFDKNYIEIHDGFKWHYLKYYYELSPIVFKFDGYNMILETYGGYLDDTKTLSHSVLEGKKIPYKDFKLRIKNDPDFEIDFKPREIYFGNTLGIKASVFEDKIYYHTEDDLSFKMFDVRNFDSEDDYNYQAHKLDNGFYNNFDQLNVQAILKSGEVINLTRLTVATELGYLYEVIEIESENSISYDDIDKVFAYENIGVSEKALTKYFDEPEYVRGFNEKHNVFTQVDNTFVLNKEMINSNASQDVTSHIFSFADDQVYYQVGNQKNVLNQFALFQDFSVVSLEFSYFINQGITYIDVKQITERSSPIKKQSIYYGPLDAFDLKIVLSDESNEPDPTPINPTPDVETPISPPKDNNGLILALGATATLITITVLLTALKKNKK